jgi:formylglycine-generating enzyme required for sulfatase activity
VFRLAGGICALVSLLVVSGEGSRRSRAQPLPPIWAQTNRPAPPPPSAPAAAPAPSAVRPPAGTNPASGAGQRAPLAFPLGSLLGNQTLATATGGLLVALLIADRLVLWKRPRWLLRLPDEGVLIPIGWEKVLPLGSRLFRSLKYRPRVLDAWVEEHQGRIAQRFSGIATVEQRRHHLSLPVKVGQKLEPELTAERLRELGGVGGLVLISGEGGVGKTSLALRIAGWALDGRLTDRPAVPVLVEADLQGEESLLSRVRSTLTSLTEHLGPEGRAPAPTLPLVRALLERRRLLVILDHFSELGDESRRRLLPTADDFPSAWAIVTSRRQETFGGKVVLHLQPQRLTADRLWLFFTDYLRLVQAEEALDFDLHERAVGRLREITAGIVDEQQAITVLLAKLYIDVVLTERKGAGGGLLPASVPALMLTYVRQINGAIPEQERQPRELVVRALQHLAQASEEKLFRPRAVRRDVALRALALASAEREGMEAEEGSHLPRGGVELLRYLVDRLLLVEESPDGAALRLVLDPLADYLAALGWLRQLDREGDGAWEVFVEQTLPARGSEGAALAQGFLRALYDGAVHAADPAVLGLEIEPEVVAKLAERAAIDPARIAAERERRRLRRLIDDLAEPDLPVRLQAIEELCRRRSGEAMVATALGRVLNSAQQDEEVRQAAGIALAAQGGVATARALAELVDSPMPTGAGAAGAVALRRTALEGLGLALAGLRETSQAQVKEELRQLLERQLHADALDLLVENEAGWAEHDRRLPLLQGASRALQLAASADLPLLGSGPGRAVPMLTLAALQEGEALRIRTQVVTPSVWQLPLPSGEQLELVLVPGGEAQIGSPETEEGRDWYANQRDGCKGVNVEAERSLRLESFAMARHAITQAQWRAVAELPQVEKELNPTPGSYKPDGLWETHAQPGALPVDSISWNDCKEWLQRLNRWLTSEWSSQGGKGEPPQFSLPGEGQWEAACRAGAATPFHFGDVLDAAWANFDGGYTYGPSRKGVYRQRPVPVGFFGLVNRWGLAELHGQLFEWCGDQWHPDPTGEGWPSGGVAWDGVDPALEALGTAQKEWKLLRGGSWFDGPHNCRAAFRYGSHPAHVLALIGVRPCCLLPPGSLLGS